MLQIILSSKVQFLRTTQKIRDSRIRIRGKKINRKLGTSALETTDKYPLVAVKPDKRTRKKSTIMTNEYLYGIMNQKNYLANVPLIACRKSKKIRRNDTDKIKLEINYHFQDLPHKID
ncbi:hypothetical protein DGG96_03550 [Legionella qingyii]|uniref:Uncharacterized protein n=1 Tax=Legionella qingyii TaxID=2184757 RepID=A0A317U4Z4_9GAMM|nr:hypothetical protein DGG96_03550 [Legionella qingyii]